MAEVVAPTTSPGSSPASNTLIEDIVNLSAAEEKLVLALECAGAAVAGIGGDGAATAAVQDRTFAFVESLDVSLTRCILQLPLRS